MDYDILTSVQRNGYEDLKDFEDQFHYPLNDTTFSIRHGLRGSYDDFFRMTSKNYQTIVFKQDKRIVGTISFLHREEPEPHIYISDFKITSTSFNESILLKKILKTVILEHESLYPKKYLFINMSPSYRNPFVRLIKGITDIPFHIESLYLNTLEYHPSMKNFVSTQGLKDILINGKPINLLHLSSHYSIPKFSGQSYKDMIIMQTNKMSIGQSQEITLAHYGFNKTPFIESYEI